MGQEKGRMPHSVGPCDFDSFLMFFASVHNNLDVTTINTWGTPDSTSLIELGTVEQVFTHLLVSWGGLTMDQGFAAIGALSGSFYCATLPDPTLDSNCVRFANVWFETFDEVRLNSVTSIQDWVEGQIERISQFFSVAIQAMVQQLEQQTGDLDLLQDVYIEQAMLANETIVELEHGLALANEVVNSLAYDANDAYQYIDEMTAAFDE